MNIALVLTVKNEARLLRSNLLYHRAIGACEIFVYFDGTTDNGKQTISDLDYVTAQDSVKADQYQEVHFLEKFTTNAKEHHTARQCLNTYDALQQCKEKGYDWLISIDADELVCTDFNDRSDLPNFFSQINQEVTIVNLKVREALQRQIAYDNVFAAETLFKTTHRYGSRFQKITKQVYNPFLKANQRFSFWYGQHMGKGAIRVASDTIPHNVHRYKNQDGSSPNVYEAGFVLHYHAYDVQDFIKKFTNFSSHPDTFLSGQKVNDLKLLLRDVVNISGMNASELEAYFADNIMFSEAEVTVLLKNTYFGFLKRYVAPLQEIASVKKVFMTQIETL